MCVCVCRGWKSPLTNCAPLSPRTANLLTGAVNLSMRTLCVPRVEATAVLAVYMAVACVFPTILAVKKLKVKLL